MELTAKLSKENKKRNFSKYDPSGTDPNRYASVSNKKEADEYLHKGKKSIVPGLRVNVSTPERILMIAAGSYLLYRALKKKDSKKVLEGITAGTMLFRGISGYCPAYDAIDRTGMLKSNAISISTALTVNKPIDEVYNIWRNLENLPYFMHHLHSVTTINNAISEWKLKLPGGIGTIGWKSEILMDEPNRLLSWHSLPGAPVHNTGRIQFSNNGSTTHLDITVSYHAPMGKPGELAARLLNPMFEKLILKDIESFKNYAESGNFDKE